MAPFSPPFGLAGPSPVHRPLAQSRAQRIERHIPQARAQVMRIHGHAAEPAPPKVSRPLQAHIHPTRIGPMNQRQSAAQAIWIAGRKDHVRMVGHQRPGPHLHPGRRRVLGKEVAIGRIHIIEEHPLGPVPPLSDVVREPRNTAGAGLAMSGA